MYNLNEGDLFLNGLIEIISVTPVGLIKPLAIHLFQPVIDTAQRNLHPCVL